MKGKLISYDWKKGKRISTCYYCPHLTSILFRMLNAIMIFTLIFHWLPLCFWQSLWPIAVQNHCCALTENKTHRKSFDYYVQLFHMFFHQMVEWGNGKEKSTLPVKIGPIDGHLTNRRKHKICEMWNTEYTLSHTSASILGKGPQKHSFHYY